MASAEFTPPTPSEGTVTLTMTETEASIVMTLLANTRDIDPEFPEVRSLFGALREAEVTYFGRFVVLDDNTGERIDLRIAKDTSDHRWAF